MRPGVPLWGADCMELESTLANFYPSSLIPLLFTPPPHRNCLEECAERLCSEEVIRDNFCQSCRAALSSCSTGCPRPSPAPARCLLARSPLLHQVSGSPVWAPPPPNSTGGFSPASYLLSCWAGPESLEGRGEPGPPQPLSQESSIRLEVRKEDRVDVGCTPGSLHLSQGHLTPA